MPSSPPNASAAPTGTWLDRWRRRWDGWAARRQFARHQQMMTLRMASAIEDAPPDGLRLVQMEVTGRPAFTRDDADQVTVLLPVELAFEAVADAGMEDAPGVGHVKSAVALFHQLTDGWAIGRCLYNVDVATVRRRFETDDAADADDAD